MREHHTTIRPAHQAGWSLIELMVVVSIITILLAILINTAVEGKGPEAQTKITLRAAMAIATEYEVTTTLKIDHLTGTGATPIARFCAAVWKLDRTRTMLMSLGRDAVVSVNGAVPTTIRDGWGRDLRYYSGEGTLEAGMVASKDPYLASAGPDGNWGTVNATTNVPDAAAKDNIYSFSLE